jgi:hypothetical protein
MTSARPRPGWSGDIWDEWRRASLPVQSTEDDGDIPHVCNTSDRLKPGHPEYRQCSCGQWFHSGGGYWYRVERPPVRWLRSHGIDAGEFWSYGEDEEPASSFGEFFTSAGRLRYWLRRFLLMLRGKG